MKKILLATALLLISLVASAQVRTLVVLNKSGDGILAVSDTTVMDANGKVIFNVESNTVKTFDGQVVLKIEDSKITGDKGKHLFTVDGNKIFRPGNKTASAVFSKDNISAVGDGFSYGILTVVAEPTRKQRIIATCILLMVSDL